MISYTFQLVIHCGVSHLSSTVTLEACSYNLNYCKPDYGRKCLPGARVDLQQNGREKDILLTNFNIERIADELNGVEVEENCCKAPRAENVVCSKDVGK